MRYIKKNQMVRIMRSLVYALISAFSLVCLCSCSIKGKIHNWKEERVVLKEKKKRKAEIKFTLDSIRELASAYKDDTCIHAFAVSNRNLEFKCVTYYPENMPSDFIYTTAYFHTSSGEVYMGTREHWPAMISPIRYDRRY